MDRKLKRNQKEKSKGLAKRPREANEVQWPGQERKVSMLQLNCAEIQKSHFAARNWFERKGQEVDEANQQVFTDEEGIQLCYLMLLEEDSVNPNTRIFSSVDDAREYLNPDERAFFIGEHIRVQTEHVEKWEDNQ